MKAIVINSCRVYSRAIAIGLLSVEKKKSTDSVYKLLLIVVSVIGIERYGFSKVSYSISGSGDQKHLGYYSESSQSGSASVDLSLGRSVRIGLTLTKKLQAENGYKSNEAETLFIPYNLDVNTESYAANLTLIPFHYRVTPFIFGGFGYYIIKKTEVVNGVSDSNTEPLFGPQGGVGLGIRLSRDFSFKITHTISPGRVKTPANKEGISKNNAVTQMGVTYHP